MYACRLRVAIYTYWCSLHAALCRGLCRFCICSDTDVYQGRNRWYIVATSTGCTIHPCGLHLCRCIWTREIHLCAVHVQLVIVDVYLSPPFNVIPSIPSISSTSVYLALDNWAKIGKYFSLTMSDVVFTHHSVIQPVIQTLVPPDKHLFSQLMSQSSNHSVSLDCQHPANK